jgi:hypothetical protein
MAKSRVIDGLKWVALADRNPYPGPRRLRGSNAQGIAFQNKLGLFLEQKIREGHLVGKLYSDLWLMFEDRNGSGYAQPDHFILQKEQIILLECKLSQNSVAWKQIEGLYKPLLSHIFQRPVIGIQAFKRMRYDEPDRPRVSIYGENALCFKDGALWQYYQ